MWNVECSLGCMGGPTMGVVAPQWRARSEWTCSWCVLKRYRTHDRQPFWPRSPFRKLSPPIGAGEYRMSGGELKVGRQVGLPRNPRARRLKLKMGSLYFWWPSQGYKTQKMMADSKPQPRGLDIGFTLGRRTGSVGVSPGYVSGRPRWDGNTRSCQIVLIWLFMVSTEAN